MREVYGINFHLSEKYFSACTTFILAPNWMSLTGIDPAKVLITLVDEGWSQKSAVNLHGPRSKGCFERRFFYLCPRGFLTR